MPTDKPAVEKLAVPLDNVPLPILVPPSLNVTVPVGVPEPGPLAVTVAVKVIDWPNTDGFALLVTVAVLASRFTVWVMAADVLPPKLVSPP